MAEGKALGRAITADQAEAFVERWVGAWNAHDLDAILSHYADDVVFTSPYVIHMVGAPSGEVVGLEALGIYFRRSLEANPDLYFETNEVMAGAGSIAVRFIAATGCEGIETIELDRVGKIRRSTAHFSAPLTAAVA